MKNIFALILWLLLPFLAASTGFFFQPGEWYLTLQKPSWTPPNYVFPVVWTILYILMGISAYLVWLRRNEKSSAIPALFFFILQLALNAAWSCLFFGYHLIGWGFVDIIALWIMIAITIYFFWKSSRLSAVLMIPYIIWVSIAAALNWTIWALNS